MYTLYQTHLHILEIINSRYTLYYRRPLTMNNIKSIYKHETVL